MPMGDLVPMPETDGSAVLHLRREYERGYRFTLIPPHEDAEAWNRFRRSTEIFYGRLDSHPSPAT